MYLSRSIFSVFYIALLLSAMTVAVPAQNKPLTARFGIPTFRQLTRNSGYIFAGTVQSVSRVKPKSPDDVGTVRIVFHVEHALQGVRRGQTLVIREWAGLWESGEHYRVGERVTLFLFKPGKLGLTSPVGSKLGRLQIDSSGHVLLNSEHISAISADPMLAAPWRGRSRMSWKEFSSGIRREFED